MKGDGGGTGQSSPGASAEHSAGGVQPGAQAQGTTVAQKSDDGGSSPLVPILIAILVLAAISVGVVWFKQRRQDGSGATPASTKAS